MAVLAIVRFPLPAGITRETARAAFEASAPRYRGVRGLLRKHYLYAEATGTGGGVYLFESREDAERLHDDAWRESMRERYGVEPSVELFEIPVVVDNVAGAIRVAGR